MKFNILYDDFPISLNTGLPKESLFLKGTTLLTTKLMPLDNSKSQIQYQKEGYLVSPYSTDKFHFAYDGIPKYEKYFDFVKVIVHELNIEKMVVVRIGAPYIEYCYEEFSFKRLIRSKMIPKYIKNIKSKKVDIDINFKNYFLEMLYDAKSKMKDIFSITLENQSEVVSCIELLRLRIEDAIIETWDNYYIWYPEQGIVINLCSHLDLHIYYPLEINDSIGLIIRNTDMVCKIDYIPETLPIFKTE